MNIYLFELKKQLKSFIVWTSVILVVLFVYMGSVYPVFAESVDDVKKMIEGFPKEFSAAFGIDIVTMFTYRGFFGFTFVYLALVGAIMAVAIAISTFAREKRSKCSDFILTKPVRREKIFLSKLLSNVTLLAITNILFVALSMIMYAANSDGENSSLFFLASCSLFFVQLVFFSIGVLIAVLLKKVRSVAGIATAVGFSAFIISALSNIIEEKALDYISPLKYFEPAKLFENGNYETGYIVMAIIVFVVCIGISFIKFCKSDAHAV